MAKNSTMSLSSVIKIARLSGLMNGTDRVVDDDDDDFVGVGDGGSGGAHGVGRLVRTVC